MAILILVGRDEQETRDTAWFCQAWKKALLALDSSLDIRIWPECGDISEIEFVLVWNHPKGMLKQFKNAKAIYSLAAGVDHVFTDAEINADVPIARLIDPYMAMDIMQYVTAYVLNYVKRVDHWAEKQKQKTWFKQPPFTFADQCIGVMGLGHLGGKTANMLQHLGLQVNGWSLSPKHLQGVRHFEGDTQFTDFLAHTDILICMLPLTPQTKHILNQRTFQYLRKGAYLINVGRGQHLVEADLLNALENGQLSGACLDVFQEEPLPADHPFWAHPRIKVTPHIASVTNPETAAIQLYENYLRAMSGQPMQNLVDVERGY